MFKKCYVRKQMFKVNILIIYFIYFFKPFNKIILLSCIDLLIFDANYNDIIPSSCPGSYYTYLTSGQLYTLIFLSSQPVYKYPA